MTDWWLNYWIDAGWKMRTYERLAVHVWLHQLRQWQQRAPHAYAYCRGVCIKNKNKRKKMQKKKCIFNANDKCDVGVCGVDGRMCWLCRSMLLWVMPVIWLVCWFGIFFFLSLLCVAGFFFCYLYAIPNSFTWVQLHMQQICWIIPFFCNLKQTNKKTHRFSLHWVLRIVGVIFGKRPWRILRSVRIDDDFRFSTLWCYFCLFITSWTIKF